jgi:hypothetical protein
MTSLIDMTLIAEHAGGVARLDADLVIAASGSMEYDVHQLRRRAVTAYRSALSAAAGKPFHPSWNVLALAVGAFVTCVEKSARTHDARAALTRLDSLRFELLPELRELGGSVAG